MSARTHSRRRASRIALAVVVGVALVAAALTACGNSDKWVGTWVDKSDNSGIEIVSKGGTVYDVHDPDGSNAFEATLRSDGALHGTLKFTTDAGSKVSLKVTLTYNDANGHLTMAVRGGGLDESYDMEKK
jgi:hypothetical protein